MAGPSKASLVIETILKEKGLLDLQTRTKKIEESLGKGTRAAEGFDSALTSLGRRLMGLVSVGVLANFGKNAALEFAKVERGLEAIRREMGALGQGEAFSGIQKALYALEDSGKGLTAETIPAFLKFLGLTKDSAAAMEMVRIAVNKTEDGQTSLSTAIDALSSLLEGKTKPAIDAWGVALEKSNNFGKDARVVLEQIGEKSDRLALNVSGSAEALDKLNGVTAKAKRTLGEQLAPALTWVSEGVTWLIKAFQEGGAWIGSTIDKWTTGFRDFGSVTAEVWAGLKALFRGDAEGYAAAIARRDAAWKQMGRNQVLIEQALQEEIARIEEKGGEEAVKANEEGRRRAAEAAGAKAAGAADEEERKLQAKVTAEARKAAAERVRIAEEEAEAVIKAELAKVEQITEIVQSLKPVTAEALGGEDLEAYEQALIEMRRSAMEAAVNIATTEKDRIAAVRELELFDLEGHLQSQIALRRKLGFSEVQIAKYVENEKTKLTKFEARSKLEIASETLSAMGQFTETAFGQTKAGAIAAAMINLAAGITNILERWSWNPAANAFLIAAHVAACWKQINAIKKANISKKGFDDPYNDRAAYFGGRKWGADMIGNWTEGVSRGWQEAMVQAAAQTFNNQTYSTVNHGPTLNVSTTYMDESGARALYRRLNTIGRLEQARTMR